MLNDLHPRRIVQTDMPGLFDVQLADGTWRYDLTSGQVRYLTDVLDTSPRGQGDCDAGD
jgi:hypothetical protein